MPGNNTSADAFAAICAAVSSKSIDDARCLARNVLPHVAVVPAVRKYSDAQALAVWRRDGYIDRYHGTRLVFPGALRLLSEIMPEEFPFQPNWRVTDCHVAYWELSPTIDHVVPIARGGDDAEPNWVTCSMATNAAKSNWTLDQLGWELHPGGSLEEWNGLEAWFVEETARRPEVVAANRAIRQWARAAGR